MYFAIDKIAMRVHISDADSNAHYKCPACGSPLTIKRGSIVAHHFSHKKRVQCDPVYASKMSLWHQNMQNKFPRIAQEIIVWNHNRSEFRIADALISRNDGSYVFEFQHSSISADEFISRSSFYLSLGHRVIWIFNFTDCCHPKCLFYDENSHSNSVRHVDWPGRDCIKLFDSDEVRQFLCDNACNSEGELQILFNVSTGPGRYFGGTYGDGCTKYMWEYVNPFDKQNYYIKPDFLSMDTLSDFYANFYTEGAVNRQIRLWN